MYEIQNILSHCGSITYVLKHISVNLVISFEKHWLIGWHNEVHKELYVLFKCYIPIFLVTWMPHHKIHSYTFWPSIKWNVLCFQTASLSVAFPRWRCLLLPRVFRCYMYFSYWSLMILPCVSVLFDLSPLFSIFAAGISFGIN